MPMRLGLTRPGNGSARQDLDEADVVENPGAQHFPEEDTLADIIEDVVEEVAAGSAGPAFPPPPPPPPPAPAGVRAAATAWNRINHTNGFLRMSQTRGKIHWDFRASCSAHDCCTITRHGNKPGILDGRPDGRPLGMLWYFLECAADCETKEIHRARVFGSSAAIRAEARIDFGSRPGTNLFLREERPPRDGEGLEPEMTS
jgi:hypothetical protein